MAPAPVALAKKKQKKPAEKKEPPKPTEADLALLQLTDDPLLGKADRIDGYEVKDMVTFTFDDGPNPGTTDAILDALAKYDIPATFFIVTRRIASKGESKSKELIARMKQEGFAIASHSVTHAYLKNAKPSKLAAEIDESIKTLAAVAEQPIGLFRAPYGALGPNGKAWLAKRGLTEAFWSIDTLDWQAKKSDKLRAQTTKMIVNQRGGVVLMHDIHSVTAKAIVGILDDLEAENCKRLAAADPKQPPIIPVSIHYFLQDKAAARTIPDAVKDRTTKYTAALPGRCAKRTPPAPPSP